MSLLVWITTGYKSDVNLISDNVIKCTAIHRYAVMMSCAVTFQPRDDRFVPGVLHVMYL